ncbi:hypothetical protein M3Y99_00799600 [Aphelenchoides fujianensis]|nr:hypothetical protein M3Y99_00799600 [Aphelenchoides fujianensis]
MDHQPTIIGFRRAGDSSDVWLGRPFRDDGYECAALTADFLDVFYHQLVCKYGRYPPSTLVSSSFNGCFVRRCTDRKATAYIGRCRPAFRRWILQQKVRAFGVVLLNRQRECVAEFRVELFEPHVGTKRWMQVIVCVHHPLSSVDFSDDFRDQTDELNGELCRALIAVQNSPPLPAIVDLPHPPIFQVHCLLNGEVHTTSGPTEHRWEPSRMPPNLTASTVAGGMLDFDSSLASFRVQQLLYAPSGRLSEFGLESDDLRSPTGSQELLTAASTPRSDSPHVFLEHFFLFHWFLHFSSSSSSSTSSSESSTSASVDVGVGDASEWFFLDDDDFR